MECFQKALNLIDKQEEPPTLLKTSLCKQIGRLYLYSDNFAEAMQKFFQSKVILEELQLQNSYEYADYLYIDSLAHSKANKGLERLVRRFQQ